jgi:hypothetical protein
MMSKNGVKQYFNLVWWCTPIILALGRLRDYQFETSCLKKAK